MDRTGNSGQDRFWEWTGADRRKEKHEGTGKMVVAATPFLTDGQNMGFLLILVLVSFPSSGLGQHGCVPFAFVILFLFLKEHAFFLCFLSSMLLCVAHHPHPCTLSPPHTPS